MIGGRLAGVRARLRRRPRRHTGTAHVGVVIAPDRLVAVEVCHGWRGARAGRSWIRTLAPPADGIEWTDLADALDELSAEIGACGRLDVGFVRPLARTKVVRPPPVSRRDVVPLLARNVRRYLVADPGSLLADAVLLPRAADGSARALVTCVRESVAMSVWAAADATGWRIGVMTSATLGLAAGAARFFPRTGHMRTALVASCDFWREAVTVEGGEPVSVEGWSSLSPAEVRARGQALGVECDGRVTIIEAAQAREAAQAEQATETADGADERTDETTDETTDEGPFAPPVDPRSHPAAVAAFGVAVLTARPPMLLPAPVRAARRSALRRRATLRAAAAVLLLAAAQQIRVAGLQRELTVVRAERSAIAPDVREALAMRASAEALDHQLRIIDQAQDSTWRWTPVVAALARELPDSVYLLSLDARGAQVQLTGMAPSASDVVPALADSRLFASVALKAPIERVRASGERFELGANLTAGEGEDGDAAGPDSSGRERTGS